MFRKVLIKYAEAHPASDDVLQACFAAKVPRDVDVLLARFYDEALHEEHFGPVVRKSGPGHLVAAGACAV